MGEINSDEIVIKAENVYKDFILPHERTGSVKGIFTSMFSKATRVKEKQHALKGVSFEIKKGEFFGIVGRNGSGKSTLLKIIAGIYQPSKGAVATTGKLVPFIELGVGFNPELSGRDNVYLNGAVLGFSAKEVDEMYEEIVSFAELGRFMDQKLKNYSSGMQVRLAFSMAVRANADILLVDEVLAVGDTDFQRKCFDHFRKLKRDKKTVVFVSHDMSSVREYCDRAVLIESGKIAFAGTANETAKEYTRLFIPKEDDKSGSKSRAHKWGAGGVDIKKFKVKSNLLSEEDDFLEVNMVVEGFREFPDGIIAGVTVKNDSGNPICGTNSKILQQPNLPLKKGQVISVDWRIPNVFNDGTLTVEPAIVDGSNEELLQWWDDAAYVQIINDQKTPYVVAPKITFNLSDDS